MIDSFDGNYRWLSNFYFSYVQLGLYLYPSVENAYQAAKCERVVDQKQFVNLTPGQAKRLGQTVDTSGNWDNIKTQVMKELLRQKFTLHPILKQQLIATGDQEIIEGNNWNDTFWGVCDGVGENNLGKLIMEIREEIS